MKENLLDRLRRERDTAMAEAEKRVALYPHILRNLIAAEEVLSEYIETLEKRPMTKLNYGRAVLKNIQAIIKRANP